MTRLTFLIAAALAGATSIVGAAGLNPQPLPPSPNWAAAMPLGPDASTKITEQYARMVARDAFFWAWPMVNIYNRRLAFSKAPEVGLMNGVLPFAPLNRMSMLSDYIKPEQRWVACPNQDVVYGAGIAALDQTPVVVQVPDFGERFWVYQIVDLRTDSFAQIGAMYGTRPASTCWPVRTGTGKCLRESPRCFAQRPARLSSCRASSWTTRPMTVRPYSR